MPPEDLNESGQNKILLTEEQAERLKILHDNIKQSLNAVQTMTAEVDSQAVLSKLATGGKKPDYDGMSTEDLKSIYDNAVRSSTLNTLSDGIDPDTQKEVALPHPHSVVSVAMRGQKTDEMSRNEMIDGIDAVLESQNYNYDPQKIATAQGMAINAQAAELEGRADRCQQSYIKMQEEIPGYKNSEIEDQIADLKVEAAKFSELSEQKCAEYVHAGLSQKMDQLSAAGGNNAKQAAEAIEKAKQGLDPTNMSGGTKHLRKIDASLQELDMSKMNFKNVDLSRSNLEGVKVDAKALSEAKGLSKVAGISDELRAEARELSPAKPSVRDMLKSAATTIKNTIGEKIDQMKLDRLEMQFKKRDDHLKDLKDRKQFADQIANSSPEQKQAERERLQKAYDPSKMLDGNRQERADQMKIAEKIEMTKMGEGELAAKTDKLQRHIDRNEAKANGLQEKVENQKEKIAIRAGRNEQNQQQRQNAPAARIS